ncbi:hypothetical protein NXY55_09580 [Aeromonas veronii]|nr:hypothetical protein [Aeromonas veronii]
MKKINLLVLSAVIFSSFVSAKDGAEVTSGRNIYSGATLADYFDSGVSKLKSSISKKILVVEVYDGSEFDKEKIKNADSIIIVGKPVDVESAMMNLLGFSVSSNAVLLDNIHGKLTVKTRKKTDYESEEIYVQNLLKMISDK